MTKYQTLKVSAIRMDGGTQSRVQLNWIVIDEYAKAMLAGDQFPPVVVFYDGSDYWLADGFHRIRACEAAGLEVYADVRQGTRRDAILYSVGANATHGLRRTIEDKRQAVELLLRDDEWRENGIRWIARQCQVSEGFAHKLYHELSAHDEQIAKPAVRKVTRNGKTYTQDTTNIGKPQPVPQPPALPLPEWAEDDAPSESIEERWSRLAQEEQVGYPEREPEQHTPSICQPKIAVINADAQNIHALDLAPVHLVVTSPPYNVGIDYDVASDDLLTYLPLLESVWRQCFDVMTDGARIAVVVPFGVGRNPWVPLAARVMDTLTAAGFTLRGQIVWDKGTSGNRTTWGSFRLASDPSLRDTTEAVIVAHKGSSRLELPANVKLTDAKGTHTAPLADSDYFMELAQDHWVISPESAKRVKHPAPFPVELVKRLIDFYAYPRAHILDPFGGSGTVAVAAKMTGCDATLVELSAEYCRLAGERINGC